MRLFAAALLLLTSACKTTQSVDGPIGPECPYNDAPTPGGNGRLSFGWYEGAIGCLFGCPGLVPPMATGSQAPIAIYGDSGDTLPPVAVSSGSPGIADFELPGDSSYTITATAHAAGSAELVIDDGTTGENVDHVSVPVADVVDLAVSFPEYVEAVTVIVGGEVRIGIEPIGEDGCGLVGIGAVDYALSGGATEDQATIWSALTDWLEAAFDWALFGGTDEYVDVDAVALGAGSVRAFTAGGVEIEIPIAIVDESAVATVSVYEGQGTVGTALAVSATPETAGGDFVHGASCAWSIDPGTGPIAITDQLGTQVTLEAAGPGSATVTCTIGGASGSGEVTFAAE